MAISCLISRKDKAEAKSHQDGMRWLDGKKRSGRGAGTLSQ
jgi:hypothetical protein